MTERLEPGQELMALRENNPAPGLNQLARVMYYLWKTRATDGWRFELWVNLPSEWNERATDLMFELLHEDAEQGIFEWN